MSPSVELNKLGSAHEWSSVQNSGLNNTTRRINTKHNATFEIITYELTYLERENRTKHTHRAKSLIRIEVLFDKMLKGTLGSSPCLLIAGCHGNRKIIQLRLLFTNLKF